MPALVAAALALKLALELGALAGLGWAAAQIEAPAPARVAAAAAAPLVTAVLWGRFAAPRSSRRLADGPRRVFESSVFAVAALALLAAGATGAGVVLGALAVVDTVVLGVSGR